MSHCTLAFLSTLLLCLLYGHTLRVEQVPSEKDLNPPNPHHNFGEAWWAHVDEGKTGHYLIYGVDPKKDQYLDIIATPMVGDCDIYASNTVHSPNKENCENHPGECRNSTSSHGDIISLTKGDIVFQDHPIHLGVQCLSNAIYSMNVYLGETDNVYFHMKNTLPQVALTHYDDHYVHFVFDYSDVEVDADAFSVSVTPIGSSDPDIYMNYGERASDSKYMWRSTGFRGDVIRVDKDDEHFHDSGKYYIAVKGFTKGMFTLDVLLHNSYGKLMESVPLLHSVKEDESRYFSFETRDMETIVINVSPSSYHGNPDLYVTDEDGIAGGEKPGPDNYIWKSTSDDGIDAVRLDYAKAGKYYIAVHGKTDTSFSIVAYPELESMLLINGEPQQRVLNSSKIHYYKFYNGDKQSGIEFRVTNTDDSGQTTALPVYASTTNTHPDDQPGKYEFEGDTIGLTSVLNVPTPSEVGTYYLGVLNKQDLSVPYTIQATSTQAVKTLLNGETSMGNTVPKSYYRFYKIELPNRETRDIIVAANPYRGDVDLFISTKLEKPTRNDCKEEKNKCWQSQSLDQDTITIQYDDKKIVSNTFFIGIYGYGDDNAFDILAYTSGTPLRISDGESVSGSVQKEKYDYYLIPVTASGDLRIDLILNDPRTQDGDIFFSSKIKRPNKVSCKDELQCQKSIHFGNDFIETNVIPGTYYMGIYGAGSHTSSMIGYKLSVNQENYLLALNAKSLLQFISPSDVKHYRFQVDDSHDYLEISTTVVAGRTTLYVSPNATEEVGPHNYMWKSELWPGNVVFLPSTTPGFRTGTWSAAVVPHEYSHYYINAAGGNKEWHTASLQLGVPQLFAAPKDDVMYMKVNICPSCTPDQKIDEDYYSSVEIIKGSANVYLKQGTGRPSKEDYTWKSEGALSRNMKLSKDKLEPGTLYFAVSGVLSETIFTITVSAAGSPIYVTNDERQLLNFKTKDESKYFSILNGKKEGPLEMIVDSCNNLTPPTFYASKTKEHPSKSSHDYKSDKLSTYRQRMSLQAPSFSSSPITYVGLKPSKENQDVSFVSFRLTAIPLVKKDKISGTLTDGKVTLNVAPAIPNPRFEKSNLSYQVFLYDFGQVSKHAPSAANFETVCAVENGNLDGRIDLDPSTNADNLHYEMQEVDLRHTYMVNVVVRDERGLKNTYTPGFINAGHISDKFEKSCFGYLASDENVCSKRGVCVKPNVCDCSGTDYYGPQCNHKPGYLNPAAYLVPIFMVLLCCVGCILLGLVLIASLLLYKRLKGKTYASFVDEEDDGMDYLDNKAEFEEL